MSETVLMENSSSNMILENWSTFPKFQYFTGKLIHENSWVPIDDWMSFPVIWKKIDGSTFKLRRNDPEIFFFFYLFKTFPENLKFGIGFVIQTKVTSFFHVIQGHVKVV